MSCSNVQKRLIFKVEYGSTFPIFLHVVQTTTHLTPFALIR